MRKTGVATSVLVLGITVGVLCAGFVSSAIYYQNKTNDLKKEKQSVMENYQTLQNQHQDLEKDYQNLEADYGNLEENHNELKNNYRNLENGYSSLQTDYDNLQRCYSKIREQHSAKSDNIYIFEKLFVKALRKILTGQANKGYASSDYNDASRNYQNNYYSVAKSYAKSADTYYSYAARNYEEAESLFKRVAKYAASKKQRKLAENYKMAADYGAKVFSEMHQANEYFASACSHYSQEEWSLGDGEIEEMSKHISKHDNLVPIYNEYLSNVDALLEDW